MSQDIYIIDNKNILIKDMHEIFSKDKREFNFLSISSNDIDIVLKSIPSLIIIDEDSIEEDIFDICKKIKANEDNTITPVIVMSSNDDNEHVVNILKEFVEYYIVKPIDSSYVYHTVKNLLRLIYLNRRVSPLTGLPGNVQIHAELKKRLLLKEEFSVLYLDLDNFKAFNDIYGFLAGDEIIKFTANTIVKNVHSVDIPNNFVGHIGGDDFVAIVENQCYDDVCKQIIAEFEAGVEKFYNEEDIERGYLEVPNRKGVMEQYPLTSISIGVVVVDPINYANILQIGEVGAQVKHVAKTIPGNTYVVNRRKSMI